MLADFKADLHIHTCLSPCGELEMSPRAVVRAASRLGLNIIAVTDHNSAENVAAARRAAERAGGPKVLAGMEVCTAEEVHLLALFETPAEAEAMMDFVYGRLPPRTNRPEVFGEQIAANEFDEVEGFNDRLLIGATELELTAAVEAIHRRGGLAIASHVDKEAFSLIGQLGFVPPGLDLDGLEVSPNSSPAELRTRRPDLADWPIITGSDAHQLDQLGTVYTVFKLAAPTLAEIALALKGKGGRRIVG